MHVNCFSGFLAFGLAPSGSQATGAPQQNPLMGFLPLVILGVVFYFILIRPQQQRSKQQAKMLTALKSGDKVITAAGLVGVVITVKETTVTLRSGDAKFEVTKASVTEIVPAETPATSP
jgi:preprotein translocase subunit YajC